jgi:anthrone oxygenase-like protein
MVAIPDVRKKGRRDSMLLELISLLSSGIFAGAALYINLVEHPARVSCGTGLAIAEFRPAYKRGAIMQAALAVAGLLAGIGAWLNGSGLAWLVGGLLLGSVIPLTLIVIFPTNAQLLDPALDPNSPQAAALLRRWAMLHGLRTALSVAAFVIFALQLTG